VGKKFIRDLSETIASSCPKILLEKPGDSGYPDALARVPRTRFGYIDNLALARTGRQLGLNAIVTGALMTIAAGFLVVKRYPLFCPSSNRCRSL
jgi:hypothetical protein